MKTLILYYSYEGNTRKVAQLIQSVTGGDLAELEPVTPYSTNHQAVVDQGLEEVNSGFMPDIKPLTVDLDQYDAVVLGSPVWWYTYAPVMATFLRDNSLAGKKVWAFATNGGWLSHTLKDFAAACPGAQVGEGLGVLFHGHNMQTSEAEIRAWAQKIQ